MIDPTAKLSVSRQAIVLGISRSSIYDQPRLISDTDLKLMHRIDKLHMEFPFAGSRMLQGLLVQEGFKVGRMHVATLMKRMGSRRFTAGRIPQNRRRGTRSTPICSGSCPSRGNSLLLESYASTYTAAAPVFLAKNGHPFAKQIREEKASAAIHIKRGNLLDGLTRQHIAAAQ